MTLALLKVTITMVGAAYPNLSRDCNVFPHKEDKFLFSQFRVSPSRYATMTSGCFLIIFICAHIVLAEKTLSFNIFPEEQTK